MANEQNLRVPTSEEAREIGRKGGLASAESRRRKKEMRETLEILLSMPLHNGEAVDIDDVGSFSALDKKNITIEAAMMVKQIQKALKGDTTAAAFVRDTAGQKPADASNVNLNGTR